MSWVNDVRPKPYRVFWSNLFGMQWVVLILAVLLIAAETITDSPSVTGRRALQLEAAKLLDQGVSPDEQRRALEILLSLQAEAYPKSARKISVPPIFYITVAIAIFIACLLSMPPRTALAIGRGERVVRRIHRVEMILFLSLPGAVITVLVLPLIQRWAFGG